jgi:hypothetical protein
MKFSLATGGPWSASKEKYMSGPVDITVAVHEKVGQNSSGKGEVMGNGAVKLYWDPTSP